MGKNNVLTNRDKDDVTLCHVFQSLICREANETYFEEMGYLMGCICYVFVDKNCLLLKTDGDLQPSITGLCFP